jgi:hypothetical protein
MTVHAILQGIEDPASLEALLTDQAQQRFCEEPPTSDSTSKETD